MAYRRPSDVQPDQDRHRLEVTLRSIRRKLRWEYDDAGRRVTAKRRRELEAKAEEIEAILAEGDG